MWLSSHRTISYVSFQQTVDTSDLVRRESLLHELDKTPLYLQSQRWLRVIGILSSHNAEYLDIRSCERQKIPVSSASPHLAHSQSKLQLQRSFERTDAALLNGAICAMLVYEFFLASPPFNPRDNVQTLYSVMALQLSSHSFSPVYVVTSEKTPQLITRERKREREREG